MGYKLLSRALLCFFLCFAAQAQPVRVMTVVMSEWNEDPQKWSFEGSLSVKRESLDKRVEVPGIELPIVCNDNGHCLVVIGEGSDNAAASIMALGLFPGFDLTKTYFLIAGIAGASPGTATIGSAAWAEWVVSSDSTAEVDRRELPEEWRFDRFRLGCEQPWCDTFGSESGFHHLNPTLTDLAFRLSKDVELLDSPEARESRKRFPRELAAVNHLPF